MHRHDPLSTLAPAATEAAPAPPPAPAPKPRKSKGQPKLPPLLRELAAVADDTLAFLYGGADQQPGDYERNQFRTPEIRAEFSAFCEQHPHYANWRQAWAAFRAQTNAERKIIPLTFDSGCTQPIPTMPPAAAAPHPGQTSAPLWQERARRRATLRHET